MSMKALHFSGSPVPSYRPIIYSNPNVVCRSGRGGPTAPNWVLFVPIKPHLLTSDSVLRTGILTGASTLHNAV